MANEIVIEVFKRLDNGYKSVEVLDTFKSFSLERNYSKEDTFTLILSVNENNLKTYTADNDTFLLINNKYWLFVDSIKSDDGKKLSIEGKSLLGLVKYRINQKIYDTQATMVSKIIFDLINNNAIGTDAKRKISVFNSIINQDTKSSKIAYQNSYGNVLEEISSLLDEYELGIKEFIASKKEPKVNLVIYSGIDKSKNIEFSTSMENIMNEQYEMNNYSESSVAYVFGEGEGTSRENVVINDNLTDFARKEVYVDARDLQQTTDDKTLTDAQYKEALTTRGKQKLNEDEKILVLKGDINSHSVLFILEKDYQIGDIVKVISTIYHLSYTTRLLGITETWDEKGYHITPQLGKESKTILDYLGGR